ncbi:hypothetical protein JW960_00165 [candidate division KSB1 bacterium]|nr:hypothetical protein [candidate division KSB1 bacterium]
MQNFCQSCGMPISEETKGHDPFCKYCSDETGKLYPREMVQKGISEWLKQFTPHAESIDLMKRADHYLNAMPAWAQE